jgi:hypothetical protein
VWYIYLTKLPNYLVPEWIWYDQNDNLGCGYSFLNYLLKPRIRVHVEDLGLLSYLISVYLLNVGAKNLEHPLADGYLIGLDKDGPCVNWCQSEKSILLHLCSFF